MTDAENPDIIPATKEEIISQIAKTLSERRLARHVTLQSVSQRLKIRVPLLEAMESGKWEDLPGDVYIRGFVLRYAQYLGIDGNKLIEPYLALARQNIKSKTPSDENNLSESGQTAWLWITLVIIVSIILIKFLKPSDKIGLVKEPEALKRVETVVTSTATVQEAQKPVIEDHTVEVISPYQLWLKITTPKKVFEGFVPEGSTWTFKSEGQFQIKLGHTREVILKFDGRQVPLFERQKTLSLPNES